MDHRSLVVAFSFLLSPLPAQTAVTALLVANTSIVVTLIDGSSTVTASQPAGALLQVGSVEIPTDVIRVHWTPPTASDPSCRFDYYSFPLGYHASTDVDLDCTLWLSGTNTNGHVQLDMLNAGDFPGHLIVDVLDDGVIEADSYALQWSYAPFTASLHAPVVVNGAPVPIRIRMQGMTLAPEWRSIQVRFVPWAAGTEDIGSSCTPNLIGYLGSQDVQDYYLAALPGMGGEALRFAAEGYGTLATFVVSLGPTRLPRGTIGLGPWCDDLLAVPLLDGPGISLGGGQWILPVPPLPGGLQFYVQHVSLGSWSGYVRFGITNVVRYQT